jgi:putative heme-binding domain-containing protein
MIEMSEDLMWRRALLYKNATSEPSVAALLKSVLDQVNKPSLRDAAILALPEYATTHWGTVVQGLESLQPSVVAKALLMVKGTFGPCPNVGDDLQTAKNVAAFWGEDCVIHLKAARRFQGQPANEKLVKDLADVAASYLRSMPLAKGRSLDTLDEIESAAHLIFPEQAKALGLSSILNLAEEQTRWAKLDVSRGDPAKGKLIFEQRQCARCHSGNSRLGPDLKGVTTRWSVADLFLHTSDPSRQISPTWEGETFTLKDGRQFTGRAVYDSPEAVLVQTTPDETVRITGEELQSRRKAEVSLMPPGLLMGLSDAELADLHAYLRSLN